MGDRTAEALYSTTQAIEGELGDAAWAVYRLGDDAQRGVVDLAFDLAAGSLSQVLARTSRWADEVRESARMLDSATRVQLAVQQARNNFEVYTLVKNVRTRLPVDADGRDINRLIDDAYGLGAYADLWAIEGLGHDYANLQLDGAHATAGILRDGAAAALPGSSLTMMHAGLGLALAERLLPRLTPWASDRQFDGVIGEFIELCNAHGRAGYCGCAYESLGLVARTWHPRLLPGTDAALLRISETVAAHFWHGAGRALYFLPAYIVPALSPWAAVDREAPHELARLNLYAGLAWASTLVNIRQPRILAELLRARGAQFQHGDAFANGVASALIVGIDVTPDDPYIEAFVRYAPEDPDVASVWNHVIAPAARLAVGEYHPILRELQALESVFRYVDLAAEVGRLQHTDRPRAAPGDVLRGHRDVPPPAPRPGLYPSSTP